MKDILLFFLVLGVYHTFTIHQQLTEDLPYKLTITGTCSDQRVKAVNQSIQACRYQTSTIGAACVKGYLQKLTNQEKWDVMVQSTNTSDAQSSYWFYNDCSIIYEQTSPVKSKFTVWKAALSSNQQNSINESKLQKYNQLKNFEDEDCTPQRYSGAYNALYYCQNNNSSLQVICIKNTIMAKIGQKWDAVVSSKPGMGIRYDYYNGCNLIMNNYGRNNRNYLIWKAQ